MEIMTGAQKNPTPFGIGLKNDLLNMRFLFRLRRSRPALRTYVP